MRYVARELLQYWNLNHESPRWVSAVYFGLVIMVFIALPLLIA